MAINMGPENTIWSLIGGKLNRELSADELALLEKLVQDERKKKLLNRMEIIHSGVKEMQQIRRFSKNSSWDKIARRIRKSKIRKQAISMLAYAAVLMLVFFLGTVFKSTILTPNIPVQYAEIDVTYGQTNHLILFDGTEVWLNSGTKFRYPNRFNSSERNVYVEGEAFFEVTPNKKLPFKVHTGQMEVEVLGTSFNISAYSDDSIQSVVLVEGEVQINNTKGKEIGKLLPGQMALQTPDQGIRVQNVSTSEYTNWKDGVLNFREERLEDLAKKLERWYNIEISFGNEKLKEYLITGTVLRNKPIDQIIDILEMIAPVEFEYIIKPDKKSELIITEK
jgi:ferric-dicitrate binding protein FerR (iron transport regulator)